MTQYYFVNMEYFNGLSSDNKARYVRKLKCLHGAVGETFEEAMDSYCFIDWVDDVKKWPAVDFPAIHFLTSSTQSRKQYESMASSNVSPTAPWRHLSFLT